MRIVVAPDSFKQAATASQVAEALAEGIYRADPGAAVDLVPLADGGEGFTDTMSLALGARDVTVAAVDALGRPIRSRYALAGDLAVIECAQAVGLGLLAAGERAILDSDTRGVGMLIRAALDAGARRLVVGLGGSATNDAGAGMLAELGVRFLDQDDNPVPTTPRGLARLARIDASDLHPALAEVDIKVACDVTNPLLGPSGAAAVYGPQKGASADDVAVLDGVLRQVAATAGHLAGPALQPGAGAAGGLGYAFAGFLGADLVSGIEMVLEVVGLARRAVNADAIFTGEGAIDAQSMMGKTLSGVAQIARQARVPLIAFGGRIAADAQSLTEHGVTRLVPIAPASLPLEQAIAQTLPNLAVAAAAVTQELLAERG